MKKKNLIVAATIAIAILLSAFAFRPESTLANSEAESSATPRKRRNIRRPNGIPLPTPSPETIQSPRTNTNPLPTPSPDSIQSQPSGRSRKRANQRKTQGKRMRLPCAKNDDTCK